jgi:hypothetical protein
MNFCEKINPTLSGIMVFYFTLPPKAHARGFRVYMGRDKYENEDLLKYGWKEDVWFHVEGISSAHVYLRLAEGVEWDQIPPVVMKYCCQLVKNNSIEGCKKKEVWIIYTPFPNLHKDENTMQTGAVSFHKENLRKRVLVEKDKELVRKIERTREERSVDFAEEKRMHEWEVLQKLKKERKKLAQEKALLKQQRKKQAYANSYDRLFEDGETKDDFTGGLVGLALHATGDAAQETDSGDSSSRISLTSRAKQDSASMFEGLGLDDGDEDDDDDDDDDSEEDSDEPDEDFM